MYKKDVQNGVWWIDEWMIKILVLFTIINLSNLSE